MPKRYLKKDHNNGVWVRVKQSYMCDLEEYKLIGQARKSLHALTGSRQKDQGIAASTRGIT